MSTFAEALETAVGQATDEFTVLTRGGVDLGEVFGFMLTCLTRFLGIAQQFQATPEPERRRVILAGIRRVYKRTNPNIPLLPEPIETFVENLVLQTMVPAAYRWVQARG